MMVKAFFPFKWAGGHQRHFFFFLLPPFNYIPPFIYAFIIALEDPLISLPRKVVNKTRNFQDTLQHMPSNFHKTSPFLLLGM